MKAGGGKAKGGAFEREVCRTLSLYTSNGRRDDLFWRSAMSGGRATLKERKGQRATAQAGDISAIDPAGHVLTDHFLVECKFYKDLNLLSFFGVPASGRSGGVLSKFWQDTVDKANTNAKHPLLIAKQNGRPPLLFVWQHTLAGVAGDIVHRVGPVLLVCRNLTPAVLVFRLDPFGAPVLPRPPKVTRPFKPIVKPRK